MNAEAGYKRYVSACKSTVLTVATIELVAFVPASSWIPVFASDCVDALHPNRSR